MSKRIKNISFWLLLFTIITSGCTINISSPAVSEELVQTAEAPSPSFVTRDEIPVAPEPVDELSQYMPFFLEYNPYISDMDVLFFQKRDIDNDGNAEIIAAFGFPGSDDDDAYIEDCQILREANGQIISIDHNILSTGYSPYNVALARFTGEDDFFIIAYVTNHVNLFGFYVYRLSGDEVYTVGGAASGTGAGNAVTTVNDNGDYDGYIDYRWSYDVLWYNVAAQYRYDNGGFIYKDASVDFYGYPDTPEETAIEFISLCILLERYPCDDIYRRLTDICDASNHIWADVWENEWDYDAILEYILDISTDITIGIDETGSNITTVTVINENENNGYTSTFTMRSDGTNWCVTNVAYTPNDSAVRTE